MSYPVSLQKVVHSNYRVEVTPDFNKWWFGEQTPEQEYARHSRQCEEIAKAIKRHVDEVSSAVFLCDTKVVCKFCECDPEPTNVLFEEGDEIGMPNCCDAAQSAWKELRTRTSHLSDCAMHNEPAYPNGPCDCGAQLAAQ